MTTLHLFGRLRDVAGEGSVEIAWLDGDSVASLVNRLDRPSLRAAIEAPDVRAVCDGKIVGLWQTIDNAREILFFPPASGG